MSKMKKLNAKQLQAASPETQNKYLGDYITATSVITGTNRDQTSSIFTTSAGQFIPATNIILNPQNPIQTDLVLTAGLQKLNIQQIKLIPPNPEQEGFVNLVCTYTDIYGEGERQFSGLIANWNLV
jgi:hypothetical protein